MKQECMNYNQAPLTPSYLSSSLLTRLIDLFLHVASLSSVSILHFPTGWVDYVLALMAVCGSTVSALPCLMNTGGNDAVWEAHGWLCALSIVGGRKRSSVQLGCWCFHPTGLGCSGDVIT